MSLKVLTIVGTRPELIKLSRILDALDEHMDHVLAHTGQNFDFELNEIFFNDLGIRKPDFFLSAAKDTVAASIASIIEKSDELMEKVKPDAILLYGDTNSCLSVIPAKRRKIPIFHLEAGNRCFDQRVPEEINRKIVDHLSDVNFVHSEHARRYLISEGIRPELIFKTGSPMGEILEFYKNDFGNSKILEQLHLKKGKYFVVSSHREENVDDRVNLRKLIKALNCIAEIYKLPIIFSTHPRTRKRLDEISDIQYDESIIFTKPLGFSDYISLQLNAKCVLSDSGTITEESSYLGFPAINIRNTHERPEGMDHGSVIMSGLDEESILNSLKLAIDLQHLPKEQIQDYSNKRVSLQVLKVIQSYTGYIDRTVWKKF